MDGKNAMKPGDSNETVTLTDNSTGKSYTFPLISGSIGPKVIDVRKLYAETDHFTYDPGFTSTGSCESKITYIDGDKGELLYRGYPIQELAEHSDFMEVSFLLLHGELPTPAEKKKFEWDIIHHTMVHEQLSTFYRGFRRDAHPMAVMCGVVGALSAFYHDSTDIHDARQREVASHRLIAKMPTIAAMAFKYALGQPFVYPRNSLKYAENFLHMAFAVPCEEYKVNPILARAMDRIFILHADHEQNAAVAVDEGDLRLATRSGGEAGIVGEHPRLAVERANVQHVRAHRALDDREIELLAADLQGTRGGLDHRSSPLVARFRSRLGKHWLSAREKTENRRAMRRSAALCIAQR